VKGNESLEADDISKLYAQLEEITRRVNATIRQRSDPLSFVEYSLVSFIGGHLGCRATDLAAAFQLNRSTTSRQVNALVERGLIEHRPAGTAAASRGQALALTERGRLFLARAVEPHRTSIAERVADWTPAEIAAFTSALSRFNTSR
jgi:DNA-binding MarR family transcriptional regulator